MKIAILTNYHLNYVGGAEEVIDRLARLWQQTGHEVVLFSAPGRRKEISRSWNPPCRHVPIPKPLSTRYFLGRYVRFLMREHARRALDVVFATDTYWPGYVARQFLLKQNVPYVVCSHGSDVMHGSRFLKRPVCRHRLAEVIRDAAGIACISGYMRSRTEDIAAPGGIVRLIHNGWPDAWALEAAPARIMPGDYLVALGRVVELKGLQTLVEAYSLLKPRWPRLGLVIAGDGPYFATLREMAYRAGLAPRLSLPHPGDPPGGMYLPGFVQGPAKRSLVRYATLGVCPSIRQEPQGLVVLEMLSSGVPVIGSNVGGIPEIVRPGINGDLFAAGDSDALAQCLERLLADPAQREALAREARPSVEPLRWSHVAQRYLELFEDVCRGGRTSPPAPHCPGTVSDLPLSRGPSPSKNGTALRAHSSGSG